MGRSRSAAGRCPGPSPPRGVLGPLWTLWLLLLGELCTDMAPGERGCASLPKEIRGVMERRTQGLGLRGLAQRGWGPAQGAPGLPSPLHRHSYVFGRCSSSPSCFLPFHGILVVAGEGENGSQIDFWAPSCSQHSATVTPTVRLLRGSCAPSEHQDSPLPGQIRSHWSQSLAERVPGVSPCADRGPWVFK